MTFLDWSLIGSELLPFKCYDIFTFYRWIDSFCEHKNVMKIIATLAVLAGWWVWRAFLLQVNSIKIPQSQKKPVYYFFIFLLCLSPLVYAEPFRSLRSKIISLALLWWLELAVSVLLSKFLHVSWYAPVPKCSRLVGLFFFFYSFPDVWQSKPKDLNIANEIYKIIL